MVSFGKGGCLRGFAFHDAGAGTVGEYKIDFVAVACSVETEFERREAGADLFEDDGFPKRAEYGMASGLFVASQTQECRGNAGIGDIYFGCFDEAFLGVAAVGLELTHHKRAFEQVDVVANGGVAYTERTGELA